jgi:hypothetical protein
MGNFSEDLKRGRAQEYVLRDILRPNRPELEVVEGYEPRWDIIDLADSDYTIEVKHDFQTLKTGNYSFEVSNKGKASCLAISPSKFWVQSDAERFVVFRTAVLRDWLRRNKHLFRKAMSGDNHASCCFLVPTSETREIEVGRIEKTGGAFIIPPALL